MSVAYELTRETDSETRCPACGSSVIGVITGDDLRTVSEEGVCSLYFDDPVGEVTLVCQLRRQILRSSLSDYAQAAMRGLVPFYRMCEAIGQQGVALALINNDRPIKWRPVTMHADQSRRHSVEYDCSDCACPKTQEMLVVGGDGPSVRVVVLHCQRYAGMKFSFFESDRNVRAAREAWVKREIARLRVKHWKRRQDEV